MNSEIITFSHIERGLSEKNFAILNVLDEFGYKKNELYIQLKEDHMEWISTTDRLPEGPGSIVFVKRENGDEVKAYYHRDKMAWLSFYHKGDLSHFQDHSTMKFLFDVTHWRHLNQNPKS